MIHRTTEDSLSYAGMVLRTVALTASLMCFWACFAQKPQDQGASGKMTARIESIVNKTAVPLDLGSPSSPARITSSQIFLDPDDLAEVRKYGTQAVPVLAKFLLNKNARIERVAIRLLGLVGGQAIADPLVEVLDKSTSPGSRNEALLNLKQAACTKSVARAILRVAQNDPDSIVRDQAREEITWCSIESTLH
jgi:hypothetical protein